MKDGGEIRLRPIRPDDEAMMVRFHETLSDESIHSRYFHLIRLDQRVSHERLKRICTIDYDREMVIVAEHTDPAGAPEIIGVGRLVRLDEKNEAEIALIVSDAHQHHGVGTELVLMLLDIARSQKIGRLVANILQENRSMQYVLRNLGFTLRYSTEEQLVVAELFL